MSNPSTVEEDLKRLGDFFADFDHVVVALSGGVDSSLVAAAAHASLGEHAIAVTADSPSVPRWQLEQAIEIAAEIGIAHHTVLTPEVSRDDYRRNDARRCFYCKETLYRELGEISGRYPESTTVSGTNADDLGDYRPGIDAGRRARVVTPLADLGIRKSRVRELAKAIGLSNWQLPASPCLASRIAYGVEVTAERLQRIERAEQWLREAGLIELRVRLHQDELARIEVSKERLSDLLLLDSDGGLSNAFQEIGFRFVTVDLMGLSSGSMNRVLVNIQAPGSQTPGSQTPGHGPSDRVHKRESTT